MMWFTDPNSCKGLRMRAEISEEDAIKEEGERKEETLLYAKCLRELAEKGWSVKQNVQFIEMYLRPKKENK